MRKNNTAIVYKKAVLSNMVMVNHSRNRALQARQRAITVLLSLEAPTGCLCLHVRYQPLAATDQWLIACIPA